MTLNSEGIFNIHWNVHRPMTGYTVVTPYIHWNVHRPMTQKSEGILNINWNDHRPMTHYTVVTLKNLLECSLSNGPKL